MAAAARHVDVFKREFLQMATALQGERRAVDALKVRRSAQRGRGGGQQGGGQGFALLTATGLFFPALIVLAFNFQEQIGGQEDVIDRMEKTKKQQEAEAESLRAHLAENQSELKQTQQDKGALCQGTCALCYGPAPRE